MNVQQESYAQQMRQGLRVCMSSSNKRADQQSNSTVSVSTCVPRRANLGLGQTVFGMLRIAKVTHLDQGSLAVV